jgi:hypothetical protein
MRCDAEGQQAPPIMLENDQGIEHPGWERRRDPRPLSRPRGS